MLVGIGVDCICKIWRLSESCLDWAAVSDSAVVGFDNGGRIRRKPAGFKRQWAKGDEIAVRRGEEEGIQEEGVCVSVFSSAFVDLHCFFVF